MGAGELRGGSGKTLEDWREIAVEQASRENFIGARGEGLLEEVLSHVGAEGEDSDRTLTLAGGFSPESFQNGEGGVGGFKVEDAGGDRGIGEASVEHLGVAGGAAGETEGIGRALDSARPEEVGREEEDHARRLVRRVEEGRRKAETGAWTRGAGLHLGPSGRPGRRSSRIRGMPRR